MYAQITTNEAVFLHLVATRAKRQPAKNYKKTCDFFAEVRKKPKYKAEFVQPLLPLVAPLVAPLLMPQLPQQPP